MEYTRPEAKDWAREKWRGVLLDRASDKALHGCDDGPMRQPVMTLNDGQMRTVRDPLARSGFSLVEEDGAAFYQGCNPA
jgi:hypothetical protein